MITSSIIEQLKSMLGDAFNNYDIPPPVFTQMQGEFVEFSQGDKYLFSRFPVLERYCNPYGTMQGGMIAAAIDNTFGPLSMLVASPSVTRRLEITYSRVIKPELGFIVVQAYFDGEEGQKIRFKARVRDPDGNLLVRARATHWVI
jgi:acyl-coenzyme A thioesterase PaaI-like protein